MIRKRVIAFLLLVASLTLSSSVLAQVKPTQTTPPPTAAASATSKVDKAAQKAARQAQKAQRKAAKKASKAAKQAAKAKRQQDKAMLAALSPKRQKAPKHATPRTAPTRVNTPPSAPATSSSTGGTD